MRPCPKCGRWRRWNCTCDADKPTPLTTKLTEAQKEITRLTTELTEAKGEIERLKVRGDSLYKTMRCALAGHSNMIAKYTTSQEVLSETIKTLTLANAKLERAVPELEKALLLQLVDPDMMAKCIRRAKAILAADDKEDNKPSFLNALENNARELGLVPDDEGKCPS